MFDIRNENLNFLFFCEFILGLCDVFASVLLDKLLAGDFFSQGRFAQGHFDLRKEWE
jgi:hypothetical protein